MVYKRTGKTVYKKTDGWTKVGTSRTVAKAKSHLRVRRAVSHGWKPTGKKAKR